MFSRPTLFRSFVILATSWLRTLGRWYSSLSIERRGAALLALLFFFTFAWWGAKPENFVRWAMEQVAETPTPSWKVATNWLNCARGLGLSARSRTAWISLQKEYLMKTLFLQKASVERRKAFADLGTKPVIDAWQQAVRDAKPFHVWIHGPGGYGKSALAFRLARLAFGIRGGSPVIPLVIEEDWGIDIYRYVGSKLEHSKRRPGKALLQRFMGDGQLCIIIDGASERRMADVLDQIDTFERDSGIRHLIVTSRDHP